MKEFIIYGIFYGNHCWMILTMDAGPLFFEMVLQGLRSKMETVEKPIQISSSTIDKVHRAKMALENYYMDLVTQHKERVTR